ncbi:MULTISPECIES: super-infection exclusion protein B [unclassified Rhizobium]|uniref:super-infection exclusion protein B n=1 Tax=unclassified Rhizobium TaxID=2613769 RepID=UPI00146CADDA|nr:MULTISPECIES: super-infection exclusion protein B [unclassified Rhizobium]MBD9445735.1 superinfection exclusion B family protein [Rhizobium sp. RHZ01]NMN73834.1 superinfection exclusion protein B [Rhizobium sp. 57MFTsu3.2]
MPDWLTNIFSLTHQISSRVALPILITTALILFLPDPYAGALGIDQFRNTYRIWIGVFLLLSAAALLTNFAWAIWDLVKRPIWDWYFIQANKGLLRQLTADEKIVLRRFIHDGEASVSAQLSNGTVSLLEHKRILSRASSISAPFGAFPYIMQPWAREYLTKYQYLLD